MNIPQIANLPRVLYAENKKRQSYEVPKFGLRMSQPLQRDTVCFKGTPKTFVKRAISKRDAKILEDQAKEAFDFMWAKLYPFLYDLEANSYNPKNSIEKITGRWKKANSIVEKCGTRGWDKDNKDIPLAGWDNIEDVKKNMTDLAGMKIIMRDSSREAVNNVIERLIQFTTETGVKIIEIENKRQTPIYDANDVVIKSFDYGSPRILAKLQKVASRITGRPIRLIDESPESNYTAIHILMELPNGITGELQIMGHDVGALKEIEDMCYKIKGNKHLPNDFASVEKMLTPLKDKENTYLHTEYDKYTAEAYKLQREKEQNQEPRSIKSKKKDTFLELPAYLKEKYGNLDFNKLAEQVEECLSTKKSKKTN